MKEDYRNSNNGRGLYIALAICILAIIGIGIYSAVRNVFTAPITNSPVPSSSSRIGGGVPAATKAPTLTKAKPKVTAPAASTVGAKPPSTKDDISVSVIDPAKRVYHKPVNGTVTKDYSDDVLVYSVTMNDYRVHSGMDIAAALGSPVMAFTDGTIEKIYEDPLMGHTVVLDHGDGLKSIYQNLAEVMPQGIEVGAQVKSGDVIAGVGESALIECAESPHLHFEVILNSTYANAANYLDFT